MLTLSTAAQVATLFAVFVSPAIGFGLIWMRRIAKTVSVVENRSRELEHNGGASMKDLARDSVRAAEAARLAAEKAALLAAERHGEESAKLAKLQHDISNMRGSQQMLTETVLRINDDRFRKELAWADFFKQQGLHPPKATNPFLPEDDS